MFPYELNFLKRKTCFPSTYSFKATNPTTRKKLAAFETTHFCFLGAHMSP